VRNGRLIYGITSASPFQKGANPQTPSLKGSPFQKGATQTPSLKGSPFQKGATQTPSLKGVKGAIPNDGPVFVIDYHKNKPSRFQSSRIYMKYNKYFM
jgi:hypothetical protein